MFVIIIEDATGYYDEEWPSVHGPYPTRASAESVVKQWEDTDHEFFVECLSINVVPVQAADAKLVRQLWEPEDEDSDTV